MTIKRLVGEAFLSAADFIEGKISAEKIRIGVTVLGSEHGVENVLAGAKLAGKLPGIELVLIGPKNDTGFETHEVETEADAHKKMEELLDNKSISACVTMHYNFPIGVSTVGRVISPAMGKEIFIATTTGTSATDKVEAMIKNSIYGNIVAKSCGVKNPKIGILNIDGAKAVERELKNLIKNGYDIELATSQRADGGSFMRGNDLLTGSADVMVCDSLTGNILMKLFSSYSTGGSYEATGYGYGPGIGFDYNRSIFIISRASGAAVIKGAIEYAYEVARGDIFKVIEQENKKLKDAKFDDVLASLKTCKLPGAGTSTTVKSDKPLPAKEVVTADISGLDVMDLDDAVSLLMNEGIYAESGMGCTGPIILVNSVNEKKATELLIKNKFISEK